MNIMKILMMALALTAVSASLASARELNESFLIRNEVKQAELAKEESLPPSEESVPEQVCVEEKTTCDKC